jgi:dTDP-4-dehydrorhamnose 3,5-epimerase-like enzyme
MSPEEPVRIVPLPDTGGDERGGSFPLSTAALAKAGGDAFGPPFAMVDAHVAGLRPGSVRGNHFHARRHEILFVLPGARWSLWWDHGEGTPVRSSEFDGAQPVAVLISPLCSHAVRNEDSRELQILGLSDLDYDVDPDVFPRAVL